VGLWALTTRGGGSFPTPAATFDAAVNLFAGPSCRNGTDDQGIGHAQLKARALAARALVGLSHAKDKLPGENFGGMKQRVVIGRALVMEPSDAADGRALR
jgi:ABC-type sugar transport system ATPase subunit